MGVSLAVPPPPPPPPLLLPLLLTAASRQAAARNFWPSNHGSQTEHGCHAFAGKGLLASDESTGTIGKRLEKAGFENTEARAAMPSACLFVPSKLKVPNAAQQGHRPPLFASGALP